MDSLTEVNEKLLAENQELKSLVEKLNRDIKKNEREIRVANSYLEKITRAADAKETINNALLAANEKQRAYTDMLLQNCPSIIILLDEHGNFVLSTEILMILTNTPNFDFIKKRNYEEVFAKYFSQNSQIVFTEAFNKVAGTDEIAMFDLLADFTLTGQPRFYSVEMRSAKTGKKTKETSNSGVLVVMSDLTEFLLEKQKAETANNAKSVFLATMSHEIRTPLNTILGLTQIQLQRHGQPKKYLEIFDKIFSAGSLLLRIINDILDLSKIETGKMELINAEFEVPKLINDAIQLNIMRIATKPIEFIVELDPNLPSKIIGDELRLKQIVSNILSNAIKYTEKGYVRLTVKFYIEDGDAVVETTVADTGQGMKPDDLENLFSKYLRFNMSTNIKTEGTGLGLYITKNLLDMMGGTITVQSEFGKGSTFTIKIKHKITNSEPIGQKIVEQLQNFTYSGENDLANLQIHRIQMPYGKVLIVDDVEANLYVAEEMMSPYGMSIETAISGFVAIEKIENGNVYDVIFMDHMMPLMDGIETTHKLREMGYDKTIIALTANALAGNEEIFAHEGFDGFISKPIDVWNLDNILNTYIRDKHPDEIQMYEHQHSFEDTKPKTEVSNKLIEIFKKDAEKAIVTLKETITNGDIKLFTTTVHAMKPTLAHLGEFEMAEEALALEMAGLDGYVTFIDANAKRFIKSLEALVDNLVLEPTDETEYDDVVEDTTFLHEHIKNVIQACENYDDTEAFVALDKLKEKTWKKETTKTLEELRDMLFLHSSFEGAAEQARKLIAE